MKPSTKGIVYVVIAALCWSITGVLAKGLLIQGMASYDIAFLRLSFGALFLAIFFGIKRPQSLSISPKALRLTALMGLLTQGLFNIAFFSAVERLGVISATLLLYLAPLFMTILSALIFKEKIKLLKQMGLILALIGSFLALTGGVLGHSSLSIMGLFYGLYSGLGYALVGVFCKIGIKETPKETLILYSFSFGALTILPFANLSNVMVQMQTPQTLILGLTMGVFPAATAYIFYFKGISSGLELSKVGLISMLELVFAIIWSMVLFSEAITLVKGIGIALILLAIGLINQLTTSDAE